jgi:hypothetical protein
VWVFTADADTEYEPARRHDGEICELAGHYHGMSQREQVHARVRRQPIRDRQYPGGS